MDLDPNRRADTAFSYRRFGSAAPKHCGSAERRALQLPEYGHPGARPPGGGCAPPELSDASEIVRRLAHAKRRNRHLQELWEPLVTSRIFCCWLPSLEMISRQFERPQRGQPRDGS